jgi:hypothetical protein
MSEMEMRAIEEMEIEEEYEDVDLDEYRESYEDYISSYIY